MCSNQLTNTVNAAVPQNLQVYSYKHINMSWKNTGVNAAWMKKVLLMSSSINFPHMPVWQQYI
jgi:hypothetical protein